MKKFLLFLFWGIFITNSTYANEENQEFKNPLFYQQLIDINDESMYLLTPTTKFFTIPIPNYYTEVKCDLLKNENKFIKMLCDDCIDLTCKKHQQRINTFEILPYDEKTNLYYIKHRVIDKNNNSMLRENLLRSDGLITVPPSK